MTSLQVRGQIDAMSEEDRFLAAAYLHHLASEKDEAHRQKIDLRMKRMDEGSKVTLNQLERIHTAMESEGW